MDPHKIIGAKARYGVAELFVFERDGKYIACLIEGGMRKGFSRQPYASIEEAKDALAHDAELALRHAPFMVGEKRQIEDLRNWAPLYDGELPDACLHPRHGRPD